MIIELVDGAGLDEMLERGPIPKADAVRYAVQILSALGYAHSLGIIHRDLKPANVIVNRAGSVKLTDFGIAHTAGAPKITRPGLAFGSLYYMSPEQFGAGAVDARSDLYSLGITLFEMLTGARPITGDSEYSIMKAHCEKIPVPPADMDPELAAMLLKSLAKDPGRRFQSAEEFRSALEYFGRGSLSRTSTTAERPYADVAPSLDPAILARVEAYLLPALGPIARHLVTKAARQSASVAELYKKLAEQIPQQREREAFLQSCGVEVGSTASVSRSVSAPASGWDGAVLKAGKLQLAAYIGPIAGIVVERAAKRAHNPRELYEALAAEIPSQGDRDKFLKSIGRG
jgi:serine/threonine protein kinase